MTGFEVVLLLVAWLVVAVSVGAYVVRKVWNDLPAPQPATYSIWRDGVCWLDDAGPLALACERMFALSRDDPLVAWEVHDSGNGTRVLWATPLLLAGDSTTKPIYSCADWPDDTLRDLMVGWERDYHLREVPPERERGTPPEPDWLYHGQRINIPSHTYGGSFTYTVESGDSIHLIAMRFGVSDSRLRAANPWLEMEYRKHHEHSWGRGMAPDWGHDDERSIAQ